MCQPGRDYHALMERKRRKRPAAEMGGEGCRNSESSAGSESGAEDGSDSEAEPELNAGEN